MVKSSAKCKIWMFDTNDTIAKVTCNEFDLPVLFLGKKLNMKF